MVKIINFIKSTRALNPGNILGVCAPSARFDTEKLNLGIQVLKDLGFKVKVPEEIFDKKRYLAGDDMVRADVVNRLFSDTDVDGIICARGGFGAIRILDHLSWNIIRQNPKPFIGFSDITAILMAIIAKTGVPVIHGPNVVSFAEASEETIDSFYQTLTGKTDEIDIKNWQAIIPGKCEGILKGGNLSTLSHLLGTAFQPDFKGTVLFLEDIGEPAYKIDRMLTQMKMAGLFEGLRGVIVGSFENSDIDEYVNEILFEVFERYNIPIFSGLESGHGKVNLSIYMGTQIKMNTEFGKISWI